MDYRSVVAELGAWYRDHPLDVTMEADLQFRLVELLNERLDDRNAGTAYCRGVTDGGSSAVYKRDYVDTIAEQDTIRRVQPEANVTDDNAPNAQFDVVVFDRELSHGIEWNDGSKRYDERDVTAAFELKFVANRNVIPHLFDQRTLEYAPEHEIRYRTELLTKDHRGLRKDIQRLHELPTPKTYLLICSQYNYLFQPPFLDDETDTYHRNQKLGWAVDEWLTEAVKVGSTDILYVHPGGHTWWP